MGEGEEGEGVSASATKVSRWDDLAMMAPLKITIN
jgi:hypothetical protein